MACHFELLRQARADYEWLSTTTNSVLGFLSFSPQALLILSPSPNSVEQLEEITMDSAKAQQILDASRSSMGWWWLETTQ